MLSRMTEALTFTEFAAHLGHAADLWDRGGELLTRQAVDELRQAMRTSVQHNFAQAHAPDGEAWPSIQDQTHPPLVRSRSLMLAAEEAAWHSVTPEGAIAIDLDLLPDYALYQQGGTHTIPARPFIGIPDAVIDAAEDALGQRVLELMTGD